MDPKGFERLDALLLAVLERAPADRAAYLDTVCAGQPELRRQVESVLAGGERAGFLETPAIELLKPKPSDSQGAESATLAQGEPMTLAPLTRFGPYEIVSLIGRGGMGEVYKAKDTRLDRTVAIKILPSADPDLRARFLREAKAIAGLQHPHICTLFDVGHQDGTDYLVLEYLDGETLARRLTRGPLELDDSLRIAIEIADALDNAHRAAIVHRDLKPANIMLINGRVKLLDFGLAKLRPRTPAVSGFSVAAPATPPVTSPGSILGTLPYMSPEQLEGQDADHPADIWAFGCIVYEMVTGTRPFEGESQASTIGAIMAADPPPITTRQPRATRAIDRTITKCLAKDPQARWHSAKDLADELQWIADDSVNTAINVAPQRLRWRALTSWLTAATAVLASLILGALLVTDRRSGGPEQALTRFEINTPPTSDPVSFAVSPDGRQLVFAAQDAGGSRLWLRPLDHTRAHPLAGTDGGRFPFWAPDSRAIGFFADGRLKRLDLGGVPQVLAHAPTARGGMWARDGFIVFAPSVTGPLLRVAASGGDSMAITRLEQTGHTSHRFPESLPDARRFLFFGAFGREPAGVYLGSLDGSAPKRLLSARTAAVYAPPGFLLVADQGVVTARRFDVARGQVSDPVPVGEPVGGDLPSFHAALAVSTTGTLVLRAAGIGRRQLIWVDRTGTRVGTIGAADENSLGSPTLAPDGRRVAVHRALENNLDVWLLDADRNVATRFTFDAANDNLPIWSPDGNHIVFRSNRSGRFDLYEKAASGAGPEHLLLATAEEKIPLDWSADGRFLLYGVQDARTGNDLWALPLRGNRQPVSIARTGFEERNGQFSPDGKWVAYESNESGQFEVYAQAFPEAGGKQQCSTAGGSAPRWRRDGRELFYLAADGAMMAVPVRAAAGGQLDLGTPGRLFRVPIVAGGGSGTTSGRQQYDVAASGQRFLVNVTLDEASTSPITVVLNWPELLKK